MENFPQGNKALISALGLMKHPEGGYFVETDRQPSTVPSPFASMPICSHLVGTEILTRRASMSADNGERNLATSIYYLLTHDNPEGVIHMNKSVVRRTCPFYRWIVLIYHLAANLITFYSTFLWSMARAPIVHEPQRRTTYCTKVVPNTH